MKFKRKSKYIIILSILITLVAIDIVNSKIQADTSSSPDSYYFEGTGKESIDGYSSASTIRSHVAIVNSKNSELSFSKQATAALTPLEIKEMINLALTKDADWSTSVGALKSIITEKGNNCWVALMPNIVYVPGEKHTRGDQTDPRLIKAIIDYIADSTDAQRISLLAGGGYAYPHSAEMSIFERSIFTEGKKWNDFYPGLANDFTLKSIMDSAAVRHPSKVFDCINTNYNEITTLGIPYNEMTDEQKISAQPQIYPLPEYNSIGALHTFNNLLGGYYPTDAVYNSDILVNLAMIKGTAGTTISSGMKNYIGSVSRGTYAPGTGYPRDRSSWLGDLDHSYLSNTITNLFAYHPADYTIIDGLASVEGEGPHPWGDRTGYLKQNYYIVGKDPIATEAVAARASGFNPNDIEHLRWGRAKKLGWYDIERIAIEGNTIEDITQEFMAPINRDKSDVPLLFKTKRYFGRACRRWLVLGAFDADNNNVAHINETIVDPLAGDTTNGQIWNELYSNENYVDLNNAVSSVTTNSIVYSFSRIFSKTAQSGVIYCGGLRDIKVWINGEEVLDATNNLFYNEVGAVKDVNLKEGDNTILVKVRKSGTKYGFSLGVVNSGLNTARTTYIPYDYKTLLPKRAFTTEEKKSLFGGRTLFGTFYHLGKSDAYDFVEDDNFEISNIINISNSPNPFNGFTNISFILDSKNKVNLSILNAKGQIVNNLFSGVLNKGINTINWNAKTSTGLNLASGVYFARLSINNKIFTRKMQYIR